MKSQRRILALSLVFVLIGTQLTLAQITPKPSPSATKKSSVNTSTNQSRNDKLWFTGGSFWFSFGTFTRIELSPNFGFKANNKLRFGTGATYMYAREKSNIGIDVFQIYGARLFTMYEALENLVLYAEYEQLNRPYFSLNVVNNRIWINNLWLGAGYRSWMSDRVAIDLYLLYDVNYNELTAIYSVPYMMRMTLVIDI